MLNDTLCDCVTVYNCVLMLVRMSHPSAKADTKNQNHISLQEFMEVLLLITVTEYGGLVTRIAVHMRWSLCFSDVCDDAVQ